MNAKEFVEKRLFPILVASAFIGIILSFSESVNKLIDAVKYDYFLIVTILWIASIVYVYNSNIKQERLKILIFIISTIAYAVSVIYKHYDINYKITDPAKPIRGIKLEILSPIFANITLAQSVKSEIITKKSFKIEQFYINEELCSFIEEQSGPFGENGTMYRTFAFNRDILESFKKGQCVGVHGENPIKNILPILHRRLDKIKRPDLKAYIKTPADLSRIIKTRNDIFIKIFFQNNELTQLSKENPSDYKYVKDWIINCMGVYEPVITFDLENISTKDVLITKVEYEVLRTGQIMGGFSGPQYPLTTYEHTLHHRVGKQMHILSPAYLLAKGERSAFNIRLIPGTSLAGAGWILKVNMFDSEGNISSTELFQIFMNK